ncbi:MAG: hypothetical protein IJS50_01285 [Desulfovibrio sp.]|nr:hypothetical protein [Desulfovibrio sp.]
MYDIRLVKLVSGELVLGKYDAAKDCLNDVAILQVVPTQAGAQMLMLPYGHPFESNFSASIAGKHFLYTYSSVPSEMQDKYLEAVTNLTVSGGLGKLQFGSSNLNPSKLQI